MQTIIVITVLIGWLLWIIGLISGEVRNTMLFFIKSARSRLKLTLVYLIGLPIIAIGLIILVNLYSDYSKSKYIEEASKMFKESCVQANNSLTFEENGDVTTASMLNSLKKLNKDTIAIDNMINNFDYLAGGPSSNNKMYANYSTYIEEAIEKYNKYVGLSVSYDDTEVANMQTYYKEKIGTPSSYSCVLNKQAFFFRIKDVSSKAEKDYMYIKPYPKKRDKTPLMQAADDCNVKAVQYMLDSNQGGGINDLEDGRDALWYSMVYFYQEKKECNAISKLLIDAGANIKRNQKRESVLQTAIAKHDLEMVNYLIQKGFKVEIGDLHEAAYEGIPEIVKVLLEQNMDPNASLPKNYKSFDRLYDKPILNANSIKTAKLLIKHGADINEQDSNSRTLLHILSFEINGNRFINNSNKIAIYILKNGASIVNDKEGNQFQIQAMAHLLKVDEDKKTSATEFIADLMNYKSTLFSNYKYVDKNIELFKINSLEAQWISTVNSSTKAEPLIKFIEKQQNSNKQFVLVIGTNSSKRSSSEHAASRFVAKYDGGTTIKKVQQKINLPFFIIDNEFQKDVRRYLENEHKIRVTGTPYAIVYRNGQVIDSFTIPFDGSKADRIVKLSK